MPSETPSKTPEHETTAADTPAKEADDSSGEATETEATETNAAATPGTAKKPKLCKEVPQDDERIARASQILLDNPILHVGQAMRATGFSDRESKDRALQQRVRRLQRGMEAGKVDGKKSNKMTKAENEFAKHIPFAEKACEFLTKSTDPFLAVKTCTDTLDAWGFTKLSKREPFGGKLVAGRFTKSQ